MALTEFDLELIYLDGSLHVLKQAPQPHRIAQGVDVRLRYRVRTSVGTAVDLTGWDITYTLKEDRDDAAEIISRAGSYSSVDDDRVAGLGSVLIGPSDTVTQLTPELLPRSGPYVADVRAEIPGGATAQLLIASDVQLGPLIGEPGAVPTPPPVFAGSLIAGALQARVYAGTSIAVTGLPIIDGVQTVDGDVVLRDASPAEINNGLWVAHSTAWTRFPASPAGAHAAGILVVVREGASKKDTLWLCSTDRPLDVVGTDAIEFLEPSGGGGGSGTVTSVSVVSANGFAGTVATPTTTPAITMTTTVTGLLKGNGTAISAAVSGTDYQPPGPYITDLTGDVTATGPGSAVATIAALAVTDAKVATANKDGAAGTFSMRTLGTGALQATAGNDARLSDDRTASGLRTASTVVSVSAATAPTAGQVLTAVNSTTATWQSPAASGVNSVTAGAGLVNSGTAADPILDVGAGFGISVGTNDVAVNTAAAFTGANAWTGNHEFNGNVTLGNATSDTVTITARVASDLVPSTDDTRDLGTTALRWKTLHVGPGSVVVHNDATDTIRATFGFTTGEARLSAPNSSLALVGPSLKLGQNSAQTLQVDAAVGPSGFPDFYFVAELNHNIGIYGSSAGIAGGGMTVSAGGGGVSGGIGPAAVGGGIAIRAGGGGAGSASGGGFSGAAGGGISIVGGGPGVNAGFGGGVSGSITLSTQDGTAGVGTTFGSTAGVINLTGGAGGAGTTSPGGGGSDINIVAGAGGPQITATLYGAAGITDIRGGDGASAISGAAGGPGGQTVLRGGSGGTGFASAGGAGGTGGPADLIARNGGTNAGFGGGTGGAARVRSGAGAAGSGTSPGATGGGAEVLAGTGGAGTATAAAGVGGGLTLKAADAGAANGGAGAAGGTTVIDAGLGTDAGNTHGEVQIGTANANKVLLGRSGSASGIVFNTFARNAAATSTAPLAIRGNGNSVAVFDTTDLNANAGIALDASGGSAGGRLWHVISAGAGAAWGAGRFTIFDGGFGAPRLSIDGTGEMFLHLGAGAGTTGGRFNCSQEIVLGNAWTALPASTEKNDVYWNLARTVEFSTGALTTQRAARINAPTYAFVGASTITDAATVSISGAPVAGTNATITNSYALWVEGGMTRLGGTMMVNGNVGFYGTAPVAQQTSVETVTNNVTSGGTDGTIANFTDLMIYANDAAMIRNDLYQLARKAKQHDDALRAYGLLN